MADSHVFCLATHAAVAATPIVLCVQVGVRKGERILQMGFGSGFKCAAAYWRALRDVTELHPAWEAYDT